MTAKRSTLPPHRRNGEGPDPLTIYLSAIKKLARLRACTIINRKHCKEALVLELLDRTWAQLSDDEKKAARSALRQAYGNRWE
jgi:hypothetical protein